MKFLLKIYNVLWYLFLPIVLFYLWWRGRRLPAYRHRIAERFGKSKLEKVDVWMHAVSVGEVVAATSMVQACLDKGLKVLFNAVFLVFDCYFFFFLASLFRSTPRFLDSVFRGLVLAGPPRLTF